MPSKPTTRQLSYLRSLANRTGQTFTYPKTRQQASAEINRLKHNRPSSQTEVRIERKLIADQIAAGPVDAARVREHEISGHGGSATWVQNRHREPAPESPAPAHSRPAPVVGKRTELARYRIPAGERILYGQRVDGVVRFLPGNLVVLGAPLGPTEDGTCRSRTAVRAGGRASAVQRKRPNGAGEPCGLVARQREDWS